MVLGADELVQLNMLIYQLGSKERVESSSSKMIGGGEQPRWPCLDAPGLSGSSDEGWRVIIGLVSMPDVDVYVTGSTARLPSKDAVAEFRRRGQKMAMVPLSFSESMSAHL